MINQVSVGQNTEFGVHDTMRHGIRQVQGELLSKHPLESRITNWEQNAEIQKLKIASETFGSHMSLRLGMEKQYLGGLGIRNNLGLDILSGKDETLDFEDYLGQDDCNSKFDFHIMMERKLNL